MNKEIKKVENYFKAKIIAGDFKVTKVADHHIAIWVDKKYKFIIWTANESYGLDTYNCSFVETSSYMNFKFTKAQKLKAWKTIEALLGKHKEETKQTKIAELKEELKRLDK
jgi:hypothetical protein